MFQKMITVPKGKLAADAAAEERKKIREALLRGDGEVKITQSGDAKPASEVKPGDGNTINVPKGKLATDAAAEERESVTYLFEGTAKSKSHRAVMRNLLPK